MKKSILYTMLILGLIFSLLMNINPVQAQESTEESTPKAETLDTILARAAAKGFLATLTRPELSSARQFYLLDDLEVDDVLTGLGPITGFSIDRSGWITPDEAYEVEATLEPSNRSIIIHTSKYNNRWRVDLVILTDDTTTDLVAGGGTLPGLRPVSGNGSGLLAFQTFNGGEIYVLNADGTNLRRVTHGLDPQLSPDSTQLVFTRWDPQYELFTINIDGTGERPWFSGKRQMKSASWSADGSKLVFSHQAGGRLESEFNRISKSSLADRARKGEETIPEDAVGLRFKDGYIEYAIPADSHWWLAEYDLNTGQFKDLPTGTRYNYGPSWHPTDPNKIILRADKGAMIDDSQTQTSQPVSIDSRDRGPLLSPDGTRVALSYWQDGHWEIHTMNVDGSNRQRLTETPLSVLAAANTADAQIFTTDEGFITLSRAQGATQPNLSWNNAAPAWSPDGTQIAFMTDRSGQWEIWIMSADGSNQRPMFPNGVLDDLTFNYAGVDERMLSWR